jgi:hypothetical protein
MNMNTRIARGPSIDGVWRTRRSIKSVAVEWREELHRKVGENRAAIERTNTFQDAMTASTRVLQLAAAICASLRVKDDIFTPEETEVELRWIEPLVSFYPYTTASDPVRSSGFL